MRRLVEEYDPSRQQHNERGKQNGARDGFRVGPKLAVADLAQRKVTGRYSFVITHTTANLASYIWLNISI